MIQVHIYVYTLKKNNIFIYPAENPLNYEYIRKRTRQSRLNYKIIFKRFDVVRYKYVNVFLLIYILITNLNIYTVRLYA